MVKIKIVKGVYGHVPDPKKAIVKPKTPKDKPFEVTEEQAERLVKLGVAEYVDTKAPDLIGFDEQPPESVELPEGVSGIPEYNVDMKVDELREIGKMMGLTFKPGTTKAKMVEEMDAYIEAHTVDGYDVDTGEIIDENDAPDFDPSEAIEE